MSQGECARCIMGPAQVDGSVSETERIVDVRLVRDLKRRRFGNGQDAKLCHLQLNVPCRYLLFLARPLPKLALRGLNKFRPDGNMPF